MSDQQGARTPAGIQLIGLSDVPSIWANLLSSLICHDLNLSKSLARWASAVPAGSDNPSTAIPVPARKARRLKNMLSGVARRAGISHPRRRMTCIGFVLRIRGLIRIRRAAITGKSRL